MMFQTYSRRKQLQSRQGEPDVYVYDQVPSHLRHQISIAFLEGVGYFHSAVNSYQISPNGNRIWEFIDRVCNKEIETYSKTKDYTLDTSHKFSSYLKDTQEIDDFLSAVEIGCFALSSIPTQDDPRSRGALSSPKQALSEINARFEQHAVGYQFENKEIIRVDSKLVHSEIIKPALRILVDPIFEKANNEFMEAHRHYRSSDFKSSVTASNRAFESMLKAICDSKRWAYLSGDTASRLITVVTNNGLFSHDFSKSFDAYISMLKSGLPTVRNDAGGHGDGLSTAAVTPLIARFALNMTASNVLFVGESYAALK